MLFLIAKIVHFIGVISWFAGLFYIVRLFVYHAEAGQREDPKERELLQSQFDLMAARLWKIITVPAMVLTFAGGITMVTQLPAIAPWLHVKFGLLGLLVLYHLQCGRLRRAQAERRCTWSSTRFRVFNEGATLLMAALVSVAVMKTSLSALWGALGLAGLGITLMLGIRLYAKLRKTP